MKIRLPKMRVLRKTGLIYFDVDDTLVCYDLDAKNKAKHNHEYVHFESRIKAKRVTLRIHKSHVELLKTFKRRGKTIVVWTHGGWQWAEEVVKALELERYVDVIMEKPDRMVDDMTLEKLCKRVYLWENGGEF